MGLLTHAFSRHRAAAELAWRSLGLRSFQTSAAALEPPPPQPVPLSKLKDSFLDGTSSTYLEELEERYRVNPASVDKTWASFFQSMGKLTPLLSTARPFMGLHQVTHPELAI